MHQSTPDFMRIFQGRESAYGTYVLGPNATTRSDGKRKGKAETLTEPVTLELWNEHLKGKIPIGIIPINEENQCVWGCIDVDIYRMAKSKVQEYIQRIRSLQLPLVPCRSKSGGMHLFLFTRTPVGAGFIRNKLQEFASALGLGSSEIFPKQVEMGKDAGLKQIGSWVNMPYFGAFKKTEKPDRYAYDDVGERLSPEEFIKAHSVYAQHFEELDKLEPKFKEAFDDGPPCLSRIAASPGGFTAGKRNISMFNLITYLRKKHGDNYAEEAHRLNKLYCRKTDDKGKISSDPLSDAEMATLLRPRKDYKFQCDESPLKENCDRTICRFRQHGIGMDGRGLPREGTLEKHRLKPPIWIVNVEGSEDRIRLTTDELFAYRAFQKAMMEQANIVPPDLKESDWKRFLGLLLETVSEIDYPEDATAVGTFRMLLYEFLTGRVQANTMEEISTGKPFSNGDFHYFRMLDLRRYLDRQRFTDIRHNEVGEVLRNECGAEMVRTRVEGQRERVWKISKEDAEEKPLPIPDDVGPKEVL